MRFLRGCLQFAVRCLLALLIAYWAIFVLYSVLNLSRGGPNAVLRWYEHVTMEGSPLIVPMNWTLFVFDQLFLVAATFGCFVLNRRWSRLRRLEPH